MIVSRTGSPSGRGGVALAAVGAMVVTLLAMLGLTAPPAAAADVITFRAATQATWNQTTARVTIPAAVREGDGMLLFVTTNKAFDGTTATPAGWTLEGTRLASTDTETTLYSRVAAANDAGRNAAVTFSATTKSTLTLLAYDGTGADPVSAFASVNETVNRATHTTPASNVATARLLRRLLLGRQVGLRRPPAGPCPPARPSAASRSAPAPAASPRSPPTPTRRRAPGRPPRAPRPARCRRPRRPCGPSCCRPTRP